MTSLTIGKGQLQTVNGEIEATFGAAFEKAGGPIQLTFENLEIYNRTHPEAGLFLQGSLCGTGENRKTVEIKSLDKLQRIASSIVQVAHLQNCEQAMTISLADPNSDPQGKKKTGSKALPPIDGAAQ